MATTEDLEIPPTTHTKILISKKPCTRRDPSAPDLFTGGDPSTRSISSQLIAARENHLKVAPYQTWEIPPRPLWAKSLGLK
eukprot:3115568-Karenia_brevis.AAC.1